MLSKIASWTGFLLFVTGASLMVSAPEPGPPADDTQALPVVMEHTSTWWPAPPKQTPLKNRKVYVVETLPASWPVSSAVGWIDQYTGSDWVMARSCPKGAYRCIFVKPGDLRAPRLAEVRNYSSSRVTMIVDLPYANGKANTTAKKKWVLSHEFGHAAGLREHASNRGNFMYRSIGVWKYGVTASQSRKMAAR